MATLPAWDKEIEAMLLRPQEMALYVERNVIDIGLAGRDWVEESQADVVEIEQLVYSRATNRPAKWVLAVAEDSPIRPNDRKPKNCFHCT